MLPGPEKGDCPCGCGKFGTIKMGNGHVKGCPCRSCMGRRNRLKGRDKQRRAQRALIGSGSHAHAHEENWSDQLFATEVKAGGQVKTVQTFWLKHEAQIIANRPDFGGQHKASRLVAMPDGTSDGIVMVKLSAWEDIIRPALEAYYSWDSSTA